MFIALTTILCLQFIFIPYCSCQLGLFYGEVNGKIEGNLMPSNEQASNDISVGDFFYFNEYYDTIKVRS